MTSKISVAIAVVVLIASCNSSQTNNNSKEIIPQSSIVASHEIVDKARNVDTIDSLNKVNCPRGKAEPVVLKEYCPNTLFELQPDSFTGVETVYFDNGDTLTIKNWGCEYYCLTFRFETSRFSADTSNLEYWFNAAYMLSTGMIAAVNAPVDIKDGINLLGSYVDRGRRNHFKT